MWADFKNVCRVKYYGIKAADVIKMENSGRGVDANLLLTFFKAIFFIENILLDLVCIVRNVLIVDYIPENDVRAVEVPHRSIFL